MKPSTNVFKWLNRLMVVVFLASAVVQYNDPDPLVWILIYGLAAAASLAAVNWNRAWLLSSIVGAVTLAWSVALLPHFFGKVGFSGIFESMTMKSAEVEYAREFGGLMIVTAWMAVVTLVSLKTEKNK